MAVGKDFLVEVLGVSLKTSMSFTMDLEAIKDEGC